jgi:penicillin-binding protein 2
MYMGHAYDDETLAKLEGILSLEPGRIRTLIQRQRGQWFKPIRLKNDISPAEHSRLEERRHELPGLVIEVVPIREYPSGSLAAHVLGRVGFLNTEAQRQALDGQQASFGSILTAAGQDPAGYQIDDIIGLIGLERQYDAVLRGVDGTREVEVNSRGTPTRVEREVAPQPGLTLQLTLDAELQRVLEQAMLDSMARLQKSRGAKYATSAAGVVLDVRTGGVLAMASLPSFDPNWSASGRIDQAHLAQLEEFNRAIQGLYTPGSTYKMMTAITALQDGVAQLSDHVYCGGAYRIGNDSIGCWVGAPGHGRVNLISAIAGSCNVYFLEMGARLRALARATEPNSGLIDLLSNYAPYFGLDGPTGIDLPFERGGRSPRTAGRRWLAGEDIQCAMGQSRQEYSPLQLAVYTATIASNGIRMRPHLVSAIKQGDDILWQAQPQIMSTASDISAETFDLVKRGMLAVTAPGGTAHWNFSDLPVKVAGKTGTAQTAVKPNDGLFTGFAPYDDPQIAWAIVFKHGESGSLSCGPVAREIVRAYFGLRQPAAPPAGTR